MADELESDPERRVPRRPPATEGPAREWRATPPRGAPLLPPAPAPLERERASRATSESGGAAIRYRLGAVIGTGGMGEVVSARDEQIGRAVAIKRLRTPNPRPDLVARFLREARIQGRLEHPAVVPVHELWYDEHGQPFFVMKQLAGITLADVLMRLVEQDPQIVAGFSRQRVLRAFADVCLAVEFAHTHGVIHRDLKPANIMLGDFGEVYVLDWGIARVAGEPAEAGSFADMAEGSPLASGSLPDPAETAVGAILGTPGYIAPEQMRGEHDLDGGADIYSLGCILFEILALDPLHERTQAALATSLVGIDARPSIRAPHRGIPPELDAICVRATKLERAARFTSARELGDAVQRFLDGDRDLALRKELAKAALVAARAGAESTDDTIRRDALRAAARALALDPTEPEPAELVARLMLEPPKVTPPEVAGELAELDLEALRASGKFGMVVAVAYLLFFPLLFWIGFRERWYLIGGPVLCVMIIVVSWKLTPTAPFVARYVSIGGNFLMFGLFSWMVSPVIIGPGPAVILVMLLATHRLFARPVVLAVLGLVATLLPWVLGAAGILHQTLSVSGTDIILHTSANHLTTGVTVFGLVIYLCALVLLAALLARLQDDERRAVRRKLQLQSWQLRQLVPRAHSGPRRMIRQVTARPADRGSH